MYMSYKNVITHENKCATPILALSWNVNFLLLFYFLFLQQLCIYFNALYIFKAVHIYTHWLLFMFKEPICQTFRKWITERKLFCAVVIEFLWSFSWPWLHMLCYMDFFFLSLHQLIQYVCFLVVFWGTLQYSNSETD